MLKPCSTTQLYKPHIQSNLLHQLDLVQTSVATKDEDIADDGKAVGGDNRRVLNNGPGAGEETSEK